MPESKRYVRVAKQLTTETAHRLINYPGKCAHLHGHTYRWEMGVTVRGLDKYDMSMDFGDIKRLMAQFAFNIYDHALVPVSYTHLTLPTKA